MSSLPVVVSPVIRTGWGDGLGIAKDGMHRLALGDDLSEDFPLVWCVRQEAFLQGEHFRPQGSDL
jgi:hypothetical protein